MTKCFLVTPTGRAALFLRRYVSSAGSQCTGSMSYHNALVYIQDVDIVFLEKPGYWDVPRLDIPHDDPRWPMHCSCGYEFQPTDSWQEFTDRIDTDGVKEFRHRELPVGAMYYASWMPSNMFWDNKTDDHLMVITPGGEWNVDSRASNCTMPDDRAHRCWVRHGEVPNVHVDKAGFTCAAGAGSIMCGNYHGFLHNGHLT
jgi:hypothetical protein